MLSPTSTLLPHALFLLGLLSILQHFFSLISAPLLLQFLHSISSLPILGTDSTRSQAECLLQEPGTKVSQSPPAQCPRCRNYLSSPRLLIKLTSWIESWLKISGSCSRLLSIAVSSLWFGLWWARYRYWWEYPNIFTNHGHRL